ncbi:MAG: hypothetical protein JSR93_01195 [Verrucomicrobia bacterium]|nr:hypothetical protein [Verrucomicrobiota bacterium]
MNDIYSKITRFAASKLSSPENMEIVRTESSTLEDPIRLENSSPAKTSLVVETLHSNGKIDLPRDESTENTRSEVHADVPQISPFSIPTMIGSPSHSGKQLNSPANRSHFQSSPFNHRTPVKSLHSPNTPLDKAALKRVLSPSSPLGNATPKGLLSPSKTSDNAESFQKTFIALSPFSPKKKEQVNTTTPIARVLFPPTTGNKSTPIPLPPPPRGQVGSLASKRATPEELHLKSELNRLKRESESRLKFSDMYGREPLSSDNLEKVFRLEGNISSCKATINLLQRQGNGTEFSDNIIKALQKSIEEHESDIKKIKNSARITLEDFESFKTHIKNFPSDELKLICCAVYPEMAEFPAMAEIANDLKSFYRSFPNNELKNASKEHSELYTKLLVEGPSRYVGFMISTIKARAITPDLEPIHEVRPFKRKNKEPSTPNASDTPKQKAQANIDLSQIANFRFKPRMTPQIEKLQTDSANSTPFSPFLQLKSRAAPQSPSVLSQTDPASANPAELLKQSKVILQQRRIEEGRQAKMQQMHLDFTREKLIALARMSLINNPSLEEDKRELDQQLAILENIPENQAQRALLEQQLASVTSKIEQKKKEAEDARQFIIASNTWTADVEHPFATKERLVIAKEYADRQMKVQNRF